MMFTRSDRILSTLKESQPNRVIVYLSFFPTTGDTYDDGGHIIISPLTGGRNYLAACFFSLESIAKEIAWASAFNMKSADRPINQRRKWRRIRVNLVNPPEAAGNWTSDEGGYYTEKEKKTK
jgi:hypothetical protein